ncbi:uncharacterized protein KGF55_004850 [Candida pseudojiufengensis]|uniref:uncharacterized protein n=1 Tax=Candida pseudojiufengensis TaxID=497109 RepID=UPI0022247EAD|nr:uncharacterized protein KGF55_004850 [Candida pseudojiufengensis]KAI5960127.1 hypothetical protein KGF55_004850 [Candida pseudojiufengensis]
MAKTKSDSDLGLSLPSKKQSSNNGENLLVALVSGCTAAAVTATLTYPFDFIKTQQQINKDAYMKKWNIPGNYPSTLGQMYKGGSALVLGEIIKNGTRLISYNWASQFMAIDSHHGQTNKTTAPRIVIAGIMSATIETAWIVPFENIKITMIQNQSLQNELVRTKDLGYDITGSKSNQLYQHHHNKLSNKPLYLRQYVSPNAYYSDEIIDSIKNHKNRFQPPKAKERLHIENLKAYYNKHPSLTLFGTIKEMYRLKGIKAYTAGTFVTYTRQIALSWVWFSSYNFMRQLINPHQNENVWATHDYSMITSIGMHAMSSVAVIAITQPLDVIKTHLQSKNGKKIYRDSLTTAYKLFLTQGPLSMFKGALPRFLKVLISSGMTATVYEYVENIVNAAGGQTMFRLD